MMVRQVCRLMSVAAFAALVQTALLAQGCSPASADVNKDGVVDDADLLCVLFNFGSTTSPSIDSAASETLRSFETVVSALIAPHGLQIDPTKDVREIDVTAWGSGARRTRAALAWCPARGQLAGGQVIGVVALGAQGYRQLEIDTPEGPVTLQSGLFAFVKRGDLLEAWLLGTSPERVAQAPVTTSQHRDEEVEIQLKPIWIQITYRDPDRNVYWSVKITIGQWRERGD